MLTLEGCTCNPPSDTPTVDDLEAAAACPYTLPADAEELRTTARRIREYDAREAA